MKTMKRIIAVILAVGMLAVLASCSSNDGAAEKGNENAVSWPERVTIASGDTGGANYYIAVAQSQILNNAIDGVDFAAEATDASPTTNGPIVQNDADCLGFLAPIGLQQLLEGTYPDMPQSLDKLRLIMTGNATKIQFITLKESGITSLDQLAGKRIATHNPGTTGRAATLLLLKEMGYEESDFASITAMTPSDTADALKDGTIDVGIFNTGLPGAAISDLNSTRDIVMLQVPEDVLNKVIKENPAYVSTSVSKDVYSDMTEDCTVLGIPMGLVCNEDMDEDLVYEITKALNEGTADLAAAHTEGAEWNTENSLGFYNGGAVPFHPGAARYYDEIQGK